MRYLNRLCATCGTLLLIFSVACLNVASVHAQTTAPVTYSINIAAGPLDKALDALGARTGISIIYAPGLVSGLDAHAVSGTLTPTAALRQMLKGTGVVWTKANSTTYVLRKSSARSQKSGTSTHVAPAPAATSEPNTLASVTVVASRLASQYKGAQPVIYISHEDIEHSGAGTIAGVLAQLPQVSVNNIGDNVESSGNYNAKTVQLRGLPAGSTLVLVNGRRIGDTAGQSPQGFFDLSTLPLSMVDHIEILPVGSSAIYGGDALAGVVNIVLKKNASGLDIKLRKAHAKGYVENEFDLTWGKSWTRGSVTVSGTYRKNSGLYESERAITANKDYRRFGGYDNRSPVTNPGNVFSLEGCPPAPSYCFVPLDQRGNLPGLDSPYAAVPVGSDGKNLTPADFVDTAGTLNKSSSLYPIFLPSTHYSVMVRGHFQLVPRLELFANVIYSHGKVRRRGTTVALNGQYGSYTVPASNPFNPFGEDVAIDFEVPGRPPSTLNSKYLRTLLGMRGDVGSWNWEVAAWQSRNTADQANYFNTTQAIKDALASSDPATALNPFEDGPGGSPELIASFFNRTITPYTTRMRDINGYVKGPLVQLPAGPMKAVIGAEYEHRDMVYTSALSGASVHGARSNRAMFTELRVPLLANHNDRGGAPLLAVHGALRADRDSSFAGTGVTKTLGIEYRPWNTLLVRATWNTAFKPPILYKSSVQTFQYQSTVLDPQHGNESVPVLITYNGVPDSIKPERGKSTTFGIVYSPTSMPLDLTVSWWRNTIRDRINGIDPQYLVDHENVFSNRVIRDDSGALIAVDDREVNINYIDENGIDFNATGHWKTRHGTLLPSLGATLTYHYETQISPELPVRDGVSKAQASGYAPRWKGLARMGWRNGNWFAQLTGRYVSEYRDYYPLPSTGEYRQLGDFWLFDISVSRAIGPATVSLTALNVFDRKPEFSDFTGSGYDPGQYDIRGRYATLSVRLDF